MRRLCFVVALLAVLAAPALSQGCDRAAITVQTDSLVAETYRRSSTGNLLAPRATVVRRLATRVATLCQPENQLPVADFTAQCQQPHPPNGDLRCDLDASASRDPDGTVVTFDWTAPDLPDRVGVRVFWAFDVATIDTFDVTLRVVDDKGGAASVTKPLVVRLPGPTPTPPVVDSVEVRFNYTTTTLWPGDVGAFAAASDTTTLCARVESAAGTLYLGEPAILVKVHGVGSLTDSVTYSPRTFATVSELRSACRHVWATLGDSVPVLPVQWTMQRFELRAGEFFTVDWPVATVVLP